MTIVSDDVSKHAKQTLGLSRAQRVFAILNTHGDTPSPDLHKISIRCKLK